MPTNDQGTLTTVPWAAAFIAGTRAALIGQYEGKTINKAQLQQMLLKGIKLHQSQLPPPPKVFLDLKTHPLHNMFKEVEQVHLESHRQMKL
jgi:hypothetical protein